jgi:hypothetical protein
VTERRPSPLEAPPPTDLPRIGSAALPATRPLRLYEVAFVLEVPHRRVRNMARRGDLPITYAGRLRAVDADHVAARIYDDPLAMAALREILAGRLAVPRASTDTDFPPLLADYLDAP